MRRLARPKFALVPASSSVKPCCIAAYNRYMGGVDISDRKIYHVSAERPSKRYWKKIFFNLLDMALLNAYELYRLNTDADECKNHHVFILTAVESLCTPDDVTIV